MVIYFLILIYVVHFYLFAINIFEYSFNMFENIGLFNITSHFLIKEEWPKPHFFSKQLVKKFHSHAKENQHIRLKSNIININLEISRTQQTMT